MGKWSSEIFPARRMCLDLLRDQATSASLPLDPGLGTFLSAPGHCKRRRAALPFRVFEGTVLALPKQILGTTKVLEWRTCAGWRNSGAEPTDPRSYR